MKALGVGLKVIRSKEQRNRDKRTRNKRKGEKTMGNILAGRVIEKSDLAEYDDFGNKVVNFTVETAKQIGGATVSEVQKVVMFKRLAEEASEKIKEGSYAVFSRCRAEPRTYTNERTGRTRHVVDVTANGYGVLTKKQFQEGADEFAKHAIDVDGVAAGSVSEAKEDGPGF